MTDAPAWLQGFYRHLWDLLVRWLRVPDAPPALPVRPGDTLEQFRPAPEFLSYLKLFFWIGLTIVDVFIIGTWIGMLIAWPLAGVLLALPAWAIAVLPDIVVYVALHVRYDTTWYVLTQRSVRIRRGVWIINEATITFENVQNVAVRQGPVQRYFGIANVVIETAGGGSAPQPGARTHQGVIEGITDYQRVRDMILHRMRVSKSAGLGDEVAAPKPTAGFSTEHVKVLGEIRDLLRVAND